MYNKIIMIILIIIASSWLPMKASEAYSQVKISYLNANRKTSFDNGRSWIIETKAIISRNDISKSTDNGGRTWRQFSKTNSNNIEDGFETIKNKEVVICVYENNFNLISRQIVKEDLTDERKISQLLSEFGKGMYIVIVQKPCSSKIYKIKI